MQNLYKRGEFFVEEITICFVYEFKLVVFYLIQLKFIALFTIFKYYRKQRGLLR